MLTPYPLANFEIDAYYQNQPRFIGIYSRDNLPDKTKDGAYVIDLDDYSNVETHRIALYVSNKTVTYFDSFGIEHIQKEITNFTTNKNIIANIYRVQNHDSIMCGYFCIRFVDFMLMSKCLTDYTNLFHQITLKRMMI